MPRDAKQKPAAPSNPARSVAAEDPRRERLARALRDNLKKRKAQQRQRQAPARQAPVRGDDADDKPRDS